MIWQRVNRSDCERVFIVVQNVSGSTMTAGYHCVWDVTSPDGVRVSQPATATIGLYAGCVDADIANNGFGLAQVYGYRTAGFVYSSDSSSVAGDILIPVNAQWGLKPYAYTQLVTKGFGFLCEAVAASAASSSYSTNKKIFIRALG